LAAVPLLRGNPTPVIASEAKQSIFFRTKKAVAFLKKSSAKNFDHSGYGRRKLPALEEQKFFWFFFFKKRTACFLQ
jgi:hypothetical protein